MDDQYYLNKAFEVSKNSYCIRQKVGAVLVGEKKILSTGFNSTPPGYEDDCEDSAKRSKWYVIHAEAKAILSMMPSLKSYAATVLYLTHSPCPECSKLIYLSGIKKIVFAQYYREEAGLSFLKRLGVEWVHIPV